MFDEVSDTPIEAIMSQAREIERQLHRKLCVQLETLFPLPKDRARCEQIVVALCLARWMASVDEVSDEKTYVPAMLEASLELMQDFRRDPGYSTVRH